MGAEIPPTSRNYFIPINNGEEKEVSVGGEESEVGSDEGEPSGVEEEEGNSTPYEGDVTTTYVEDNV